MEEKFKLQRAFFVALGTALEDPINKRVIIETKERTRDWEEGSKFNIPRYYMIDAISAYEDDAKKALERWGEWQVAASDGHCVVTRNIGNISRFAMKMIEKGRAVEIYCDGY